ncbi:serine/threonine protein kinase [Streptomyces sp. BK208]|uniref:serine/threonine-protein kinase n=1 Tax=Streptomyces sp. BK208 TaxID=2512150 RepID=UPI00105D46C9|nr:serine/threonine-protein kinase [Streptomyces sp. BK208]TDT35192.1 serine/threonine protein kinase [Streptomyces sp. BK208]
MRTLGDGDPQNIGAYRLLGRLGAGGMGHVYLARSDRGRTVAVKLVREELAALEEFRERFRQEVESARRVGGYWTAPVLDADTEAAVPWVATGYVAGPSLQQVVGHDHGALPERSVRTLGAGLAHALQDIHAAGIVHRDLKPSNVLVTIDGPRVIDFGIARALETVTDGGLTRTGALVGSPGFMAPEQVRGDRITPACDVFCLGSVLAYAATGRLPFGTANSGVHALMFRIAQEEPVLEGVPEGIADLVRDCLKKDPAARPGLAEVLERTGAQDTVSDGRSRDPWLPGALVAQLGRHAVRLLDTENPEDPGPAGSHGHAGAPGTPAADAAAVRGGAGPGGAGSGGGEHGGVAPGGAGSGGARPGGVASGDETPGGAEHGGVAPGGARSGGEAPHGAAPHGETSHPETPGAAHPSGAAPDGTTRVGPPPPREPGSGVTPLNHLPTMVAGQAPPTPPPTAHGHPQPPVPGYAPAPAWQASQPGYRPPYGAGGGLGPTPPQGPPPQGPLPPGLPPQGPAPYATPPYATPPYGPPPYGPPRDPARNGRSTALLIVVALVVALGAGGTVYALMRGGGDQKADGGSAPTRSTGAPRDPSTDSSGTSGTTADGSPSTGSTDPAADEGPVPAAYVGDWTTTIDNTSGTHPRKLSIVQGEVGDTVLTLVADGPTDTGTYHCVFEAALAADPGGDGPLRLGPSQVTTGPSGSCAPGGASTVTLLPGGGLERTNEDTGESLVYTRAPAD